MPDLITILSNIGSQIAPIIMMLQGIAALMGLLLTSSAFINFWGSSTADNKFLASNQRYSVMVGIVQLLLGAFLLMMGTLELVGILSRSITGDYANSRFMSYSGGTSTFEDQRLAAMAAILGIMQIVGFVAMVKGIMVFNGRASGRSNASYGIGIGWLIGGIICWNFKWFTDVLNCSLGYNVIGIFMPFGVSTCSP